MSASGIAILNGIDYKIDRSLLWSQEVRKQVSCRLISSSSFVDWEDSPVLRPSFSGIKKRESLWKTSNMKDVPSILSQFYKTDGAEPLVFHRLFHSFPTEIAMLSFLFSQGQTTACFIRYLFHPSQEEDPLRKGPAVVKGRLFESLESGTTKS